MKKYKSLPKKTVNKSAVKTTYTCVNVWKSCAESKGLNDNIIKNEARELDEGLSRFFAEIRKSDDSDYSLFSHIPQCLAFWGLNRSVSYVTTLRMNTGFSYLAGTRCKSPATSSICPG